MKIGITINFQKGDSLFSNGIKQNVINLAKVFKNSKKNYDVNIINIINSDDIIPDSYEWDNEIKTINFREISNDDISTFDIWIILAIVPTI